MRSADALAAATDVLKSLREANHQAFFAGGCVRDHLLGWEPSDYDVATSASPDEVEDLFPRTIAVGKAFGVINVPRRGRSVEVATFRAEGSYSDGRHPDGIRFTDAREDVLRRDFTINGLLMCPLSGEILDFVGGQEDLKRGLVRAIGDADARLHEDALRILRAVRFASLGPFRLEDETEDAVIRHRDRLSAVSAERIHDELRKIATNPRARRGDAWRTLHRCGLDRLIFGFSAPAEIEDQARDLDRLSLRSLPLLLAVILRAHPKLGTTLHSARSLGERIARELRCSQKDRELLAELCASRLRYRNLEAARPGRRLLLATREDREAHEDLLAAEGDPSQALPLLRQTRAQAGEERPAPLVDGRDAMAVGIPKGRRIGRALRRVRVLQLEGRLEDREAALAALTSR